MPIKTEHGWLLFYHGYGEKHVYRQSIALLDLEDPTKIINRPKAFIMEPKEKWEIGRAMFPMSYLAVPMWSSAINSTYYGGADRVIGLATAPFADVEVLN